MQWYYSKNGTQLGPISTEALLSKLASGEVSASDLVWKDGMADWLPAGQVAELRTAAPLSPAATPTPVVKTTSPYETPVASHAAPQTPFPAQMLPGAAISQGLAIGSMVCGIIGLLGCCAWCLSGPLAIIAVVLGHVALSKAKAEPARYGGKGMAKAGLVTGYLALLFTLLFHIFGLWAQTLSPEKIEKMEFLPKEMREEIRKQSEVEKTSRSPVPATQ
jgi:hypothetical protein